MKCERGLCLVCEKVIAQPCDHCGGGWKNTEDYTHVELNWSNGSRMQVAVCIGCSKGPVWAADKALLTKAIHEAWDKQGGSYDRSVVVV